MKELINQGLKRPVFPDILAPLARQWVVSLFPFLPCNPQGTPNTRLCSVPAGVVRTQSSPAEQTSSGLGLSNHQVIKLNNKTISKDPGNLQLLLKTCFSIIISLIESFCWVRRNELQDVHLHFHTSEETLSVVARVNLQRLPVIQKWRERECFSQQYTQVC